VKIHPCMTAIRFNGEGSTVKSLVFSRVTDFQVLPSGEVKFNVVPESEQTVPADTVIFSIGQSPDLDTAGKELTLTAQGNLKTDIETCWTGKPGIFATGDCCTGATSIIEAIADGQKAAFFIDRYLHGDVLHVRPVASQDPLAIKVTIPASRTKRQDSLCRSHR